MPKEIQAVLGGMWLVNSVLITVVLVLAIGKLS